MTTLPRYHLISCVNPDGATCKVAVRVCPKTAVPERLGFSGIGRALSVTKTGSVEAFVLSKEPF